MTSNSPNWLTNSSTFVLFKTASPAENDRQKKNVKKKKEKIMRLTTSRMQTCYTFFVVWCSSVWRGNWARKVTFMVQKV